MCGICGVITKKTFNEYNLREMNNSMIHRGPDDSGEYFHYFDDWVLGFGHRRLSIIDLSTLGHQPMFSQDNRISLVFNGEIYNYREIKKELINMGYKFISKSDSEVIIYAFVQWGPNFINKLNGMFSIAIFDKQDNSLYLYRDRIGKKPLYCYSKADDFIFASELKPIMKYPHFDSNINSAVLNRYIKNQYINSPDTIFDKVFKLEPGSMLVWKNGDIKINKYWDLLEVFASKSKSRDLSYDDTKQQLIMLLEDAVKQRMISDVPLGMFLSGGIDSTLVTAIAQKQSNKKLKTFSIGFYENQYNEANFAKAIADYLGTEHYQEYVNEQQMLELFDSIPHYYDEPLADNSQIPTMLVSRLAREHVTVALSGDGGDELFCGYNIYDVIKKREQLVPMAPLLEISNIAAKKLNLKLPRKMATALKLFERNDRAFRVSPYVDKYYCSMAAGCQQSILYNTDNIVTDNIVEARMLLDMITYLPDDILVKVDRASMKYSLEARCPLLDYRIVELSFAMQHDFKYRKGAKKYILKDILYDMIPQKLVDRPKTGFASPISRWLCSSLKERLEYYTDEAKLRKQGLFNPTIVTKCKRALYSLNGEDCSEAPVLWSLLIFEMWHDAYIAKY